MYVVDGERPERPKARLRVPAGAPVLMRLPGGGGYGDPLQRRSEAVVKDVAAGLVSSGAAREQYGVVGRFVDGAWVVDTAATETERTERRNARSI